jgi:hypothetical protein
LYLSLFKQLSAYHNIMNKPQAIIDFFHVLRKSIQDDTFIKMTLSKPARKEDLPQNVYLKLIELKGSPSLHFVSRYATKDITKNYSTEEGINLLQNYLGSDFLHASLFTAAEDVSLLFNKKRKARMLRKKASLSAIPERAHDHKKQYFIAPSAPYFPALGISNKEGKVLAQSQRKFRQINKYIDIIDSLLKQQADFPAQPHIVDMGSGKGYLTFSLYEHLTSAMQLQPTIVGIELRQQLVDFCNGLARRVHYDHLSFVASDINDYAAEKIDMLIALHACDIATDIAIAKGIQANARMIIVAPCCHKQIRKQMHCQTASQSILRHGILEERQAEIVTDGIRALIMEAFGYETRVFEFISTEHTPKNVMIVGTKGKANEKAWESIAAIKKDYGIDYHYLEKLVKA